MSRPGFGQDGSPDGCVHAIALVTKPARLGAGPSDAHHLGRPFSSTPARPGGRREVVGPLSGHWPADLGTGGAGAGSGGRSCITACGAASRTRCVAKL